MLSQKHHFLVVTLSLSLSVCYVVAATNSTTTSTPGSNPQTSVTSDGKSGLGQITPLEKGILNFFDITHGFLNAVQKDDFVDSGGNSAISFNEIESIIRNGTYSELQGRWQDLVKVFGGYAACVIVGLLFFILMPIAGMFFCCCYCCCKNCGKAKQKEDPKNAKCKRTTYCFFFTIFSVMILAGGIVAVISNELLHEKLQNSDQRGPVQYMNVGLQKLVSFATGTTEDIMDTGKKNVKVTVVEVKTTVQDAAGRTVNGVMNLTNADKLLDDTDRLGRDANTTFNKLEMVASTLTELQNLTAQINNNLTAINNSIQSKCSATTGCPTFPNIGPNFNGLDKLTTIANEVSSSLDITSLSKMARSEFDIIKHNISTTLNSSIAEATKQADDIETELINSITKINDTVQPLVDTLTTSTQSSINDIDKYLKEYGDYWWYGGIGVSCTLILIVAFYFFALLFGMCGERPGHHAPCCNRGAGSNLIVAGVVFSFFFSWILIMIVMVLFLPGGLLYTNFCRYMNDGVENVGKYEEILSTNFDINVKSLMYSDGTAGDFTVGGALKSCKINEGFYKAFHLQNAIDLDSVLNISQVVDEVNKLVDQIPTVGNINIIPQSLNDSLTKFADSGLLNINFTEYDAQLDTPVINLTQHIADLRAVNLTAEADSLQSLQDNEIQNLTTLMGNLRTALNGLKNNNNLTQEVTSVIQGLNKSQERFNDEGQTLVSKELNKTVDYLVNYVNSSIESVKNKIKNDIGKCRSVYDAAQMLSDSFCVVLLDPLNGFWFGIGWGLAFFIPAMIFGMLLANLYQREEPFDRAAYKRQKRYQQEQDFESPDMATYQDRDNIPLTNVDGGRYPRGSNGAVNAGYNGYNQHHNDHQYNRRTESFDDPYHRYDHQGRDPYYRNGERGQPPPYDYQPPPRGGYPVMPKQRY